MSSKHLFQALKLNVNVHEVNYYKNLPRRMAYVSLITYLNIYLYGLLMVENLNDVTTAVLIVDSFVREQF